MKLAPMNYHYLRYPLNRFLDKVERSPFDSIDLYCSAPQLNIFDYSLSDLLTLDKEIRRRHLSVMAMTPENCTYPVNFCTQDQRRQGATLLGRLPARHRHRRLPRLSQSTDQHRLRLF